MKGFLILFGVAAIFGTAFGLSVLRREGTPPPECPEPSDNLVTLPNPDDCSTFYKCEGYEAILLPCYNGTWFNPEAGVCDWPDNVPEGVCIPPPEVSEETEEDENIEVDERALPFQIDFEGIEEEFPFQKEKDSLIE